VTLDWWCGALTGFCVGALAVTAAFAAGRQILRRIARRCDTHDTASPAKIRQLETDLGIEPSAPTGDLVDQLTDPDIIDCGKPWCRTRHS
jgi:hypothetical protein